MNFKKEKFTYWLMGLGSGVILSGIVMTGTGLIVLSKEHQTDQKSVAIAKDNLHKQLQTTKVDKPEEKIPLEETKPIEETKSIEKMQPLEKNENEEATKQKTSYKTIYIPTEASSEDVSKLLEQEGLVKDEKLFLKYIVEQGKERKLRSGNFEIPKESTYEEVLRILLRK